MIMERRSFDREDMETNRVTGALGYLIFFIPLIACPNSRYGRYTANQGLLLWIAYAVVALALGLAHGILGWIPIIGFLVNAIRYICQIAIIAVSIYCLVKALNGEAYEIPYIGKTTLIK